MIRSLRARLLIGISLATALILGLLSLGIYWSVRGALFAEFDGATRTKAMALASMTEQRGGKVTFDFDDSDMPEFAAPHHPDYFEIWLDDGSVLGRSKSLGGNDLPRPDLTAKFPGDTGTETVFPNKRHGRLLTYSFVPSIDRDRETGGDAQTRRGVIIIGREIHDVHEVLEYMGGLMLGLCLAAIVLSGVVLVVLVGRTLAPVRKLARQIDSLGESDLSHRFEPDQFPSEIRSVAERMNALLKRLQDAFARERSFSADVAHELRTPLAGLRTTLEVCRSRPRSAGEYEEALDRCTKLAQSMQEMVDRLLMLVRADSGQLVVRNDPVNLTNIVEECWTYHQARAAARGLKDQWELPPGCEIRSDGDLLRLVLNNLLDNAVSHADPGGTLQASVAANGDSAEVCVANSGSKVESADVGRLFDRFWRGDTSRTQTETHCGLGLSLCQRLSALLGGSIEVESSNGGWFTARLRLPITRK